MDVEARSTEDRDQLRRLIGNERDAKQRDRYRAVADQPDATLVELRQHLGVNCSLSAICKVLKQLKLRYKKR